MRQPAVAELVGRGDPLDPCELDPQDDAFADWQTADGARLVLYAFPWEDRVDPVPEATWRNRLAYEVFDAEAGLHPGEHLPWEEIGVPIGLVGFGDDGAPRWVDGFAVVRDGGRPHRRTPLLSAAGDAFLWQARLKQFAEQVAEVDWTTADPMEAFRAFAWLPPAGLLPRAAVQLRAPQAEKAEMADPGPTTAAFPEDYRVEAVPIPLEQLDAAIEASAALEPFSATIPDRVRLLVPVPQAFYEPRLLQDEVVDPQFQQEIDALKTRRTDLLLQREDVQRRAEALGRALAGRVPGFVLPQEDPDRLEPNEDVSLAGQGLLGEYFLDRNLTPPAAAVRVEAVNFDWAMGSPPPLVSAGTPRPDEFSARWSGTVAPRFSEPYTFFVTADDGVRLWVNGVLLVDDWAIHPATEHSGTLALRAGVRYDLRLEYFEASGAASVKLHWASPSQPREPIPAARLFVAADTTALPGHTPVEDDFGTAAPAGAPARRTTALDLLGAQLKGVVAADDLALLPTEGIDAFIRRLDARIKRVDDQADFGFLRVQSDMYRLRQLMLGATSATRLATSPALA
ncbi:MAG TPA: PA14 domain-containing protein, partial [Longimicrobium sp.]